MKKLYPIFFFTFLFFLGDGLYKKAYAQDCSTLSITTTTTESRCMSTGSVTVNVTGGTGSYNYKVTGPVSTSFTSSNVITGLEPGTYDLVVKDVNSGCQQTSSITISGSYSDPRFDLTKTDVSCLGNDGTITTGSLQYGRSPFTYSIISPSPSNVGATNATCYFTGLTAGEYAIQLKDSCGGIQVRRITVQNYSWWFDHVDGDKIDCDNAEVTVVLKDNKGNYNTSGTNFSGFTYRIVSPVVTSWQSGNTIAFTIGNSRSAKVEAKDACGNVYSAVWNIPSNEKPSVGSVDISNRTCSDFTATVNGQQNLNGVVTYTLVDNNGATVTQNSTGIFTNQSYGSYCIRIYDDCYDTTMERCFSAARYTPSVASTVSISNRTCSTFTASITGQTNLTNPEYCLFDNNNNPIQTCNSTGVFSNISYGSYYITVHDRGCVDTVFSRSFVEAKPVPGLNNVTVSGTTCTGFNIQTNGGTNLFTNPRYCLYDVNGNEVICNNTGVFTGISPLGTYCVRAITSCSDTTAPVCVSVVPPTPSVAASVQLSNKTCTTFTATITGKTNLTNPEYCLFDAANNPLLLCNNTGVFDNLPYGSYKITITDGCVDTVITRNFSASQPVPGINGSFTVSNKGCSSFTATVSGNNLISPTYYLFDENNNEVAHNTTGVFNNLPYGRYCAEIKDACGNTTARNCQTVSVDKGITVSASKTCTYDYTSMQISFAGTNKPYTINIYHPSGALVYNTTTNNTTTTVTSLPSLPDGLQYKVVGNDLCNNADSILVVPVAAHITKTVTVNSKCPSAAWQNGSGDISVTCSSNYYTVTPALIKKDGFTYNAGYSSNSGSNYIFSDLGPGTYIIQYTMQNCSGKQYDTVTVAPYTFPNQSKSAVYQCNDLSFSLGASVTGGVGPYQYEIIGSTPSSPSIVTPKQSSAVFAINNGTTYSLIRLRSTDACGNAALNDVSVLPLQNISVKANSTCLYNNITLSVDTIANATYQWYKKRTPTDSTLLDDSIVYNIPFLEPEDVGTYVCKVSVNNDCLTRLSYFEITGDCGHTSLQTSVRLQGKKMEGGNQLSWIKNNNEAVEFIVERKIAGGQFTAIGSVKASAQGNFFFTDSDPVNGKNVYRLKVVTVRNSNYTNLVDLSWGKNTIVAYPNPVKDKLMVATESGSLANYEMQLVNAAGQTIHRESIKGSVQTYTYHRGKNTKPGMYLLKLVNQLDQTTDVYKLLFE